MWQGPAWEHVDSKTQTERERDVQKHSDREKDREERLEDIGSKRETRRERLEERAFKREAQRHRERLQEKEMMFAEQEPTHAHGASLRTGSTRNFCSSGFFLFEGIPVRTQPVLSNLHRPM